MLSRQRRVLTDGGIILLILLLYGCQTEVTPTPLPTEVITAMPSGGLGLSRAVWEQKHGRPNKESEGTVAEESLANYEGDKYSVEYWNSAVVGIARFAKQGNVLTLEQAREEARSMLPSDAQFLTAYRELRPDSDIIDTVETFTSAWLSMRYPSGPKIGHFTWHDGAAGSIAISYSGNRDDWSIDAGYSGPVSTPLPLP